jgi:hypothetical protein
VIRLDKLQDERKLGDELFAEMIADIKQYIHERFQAERRVPGADEILADMYWAGNVLNNFLKGLQPVRQYAVNQFTYRLSETVRVAKYEYERELSA